ncbi:T-box [Oesophagostomum dentatum]|uniref:T-box n=1 Tax=Oesophagostomum dentatum TaxID=61180 RepID=A0A0B1THM5_OESDE|nr:T-box [Oesophagostomum dentatum]
MADVQQAQLERDESRCDQADTYSLEKAVMCCWALAHVLAMAANVGGETTDTCHQNVLINYRTPPSVSEIYLFLYGGTTHVTGFRMPKNFSIDYLLSDFHASKETEEEEGVVKCDGIRFKLEGVALWRRFHALGTEMIVTKSGRRMFPVLSISISGLDPTASYSLMVDMECVDSKRYRYSFHQSKWTATGPGSSVGFAWD